VQGEYISQSISTSQLEGQSFLSPTVLNYDAMMEEEEAEESVVIFELAEEEFHETADNRVAEIDVGNIDGFAVTVDMLLNMKAAIDFASSHIGLTLEDKVCLELEEILRTAGTPLYLYNKIMKWACQHKDALPSGRVPLLNCKALYCGMSRKLHGDSANIMKPKEIPTTLPSGHCCGVTVFNLYSQIMS
jgi:hypothetical protein